MLLTVIMATALISCGTPKAVTQSKKVLKGYWSLDNISYSEAGTYNVNLFGDANKDCFVGSTWRFIPNNNTAVYTINGANCSTGDRNFIFTIDPVDPDSGLYDFLIKPTDDKGKSENKIGYRVNLAQLSETSMMWIQTVNVDGKPFRINMNFSKINE